jgi:hypothetical protein
VAPTPPPTPPPPPLLHFFEKLHFLFVYKISPMLYLSYMKKVTRFLITMLIVLLANSMPIRSSQALAITIHPKTSVSMLTPTPNPGILPTQMEATATIDPASIGDTSGVIAIGMLIVFIILLGIIWGSRGLKLEPHKVKKTRIK